MGRAVQKINRREFLKKITAAASSGAFIPFGSSLESQEQNFRVKNGDMYYRRLGSTGLFISEISLGGSPVPDDPLLYRAVERGVNYIDTSHNYMNGNSERKIGKLCRDVGREKIHVATKFHLRGKWSKKSIIESVNGSLKRLQSDYIDILLIHGAEDEKQLTDERLLEAFEELKKEGKYMFRGLSCHSNHHRVVKRAVECGYYDMVQLAYNVFDIRESEKKIKVYDDYLGESGTRHLISFAHSRDVGIIAMKVLKVGGKRQNIEKYRTGTTSLYQAMLKWALENRKISSVVTEMLTYKQLEEDLAVVGTPLSEEEKKTLFRYVAESSTDYCHMCGDCEISCPSGIKTTVILRYLSYYESYDKKERAIKAYARLKPSQTALSCQDCGQCEKECLYAVAVRRRIREAHSLLH
ncbi:MAG: aldo/keto reductase [Candidatus Aminicenantales bacterium]